jgi:hypothetical protein
MIRATQPNETMASETMASETMASETAAGTHQSAATPSSSVERAPKASRKPKGSHSMQGGSSAANHLAVVILEVLAGVKTPTQAAADLGLSLPRYYQLETRALEGLVAALEPRPKGKQPLPANQIAALERELEQARRACARQQALARVAQRTLAVKLAPRPKAKPTSAPAAEGKSPPPRDRTGRRRRRPAVRALKAVQALRKNLGPAEGEAVEQPAPAEAAAPPREPQREPVPLGV